MKVRPYDKTIQTLFDSGFYVIPRFQRPYSWEKEHISDFWSDIIENEDNDYFIGSMVLYSNKSDFMVVDGQQRLTTITILLCSIRDKFVRLGENDLAEGLQGVLERKDINAQTRYTLFSEAPYPFFQNHIQKMGDPDHKAKIGEEEFALKAAYDDLCSYLEVKLVSIEKDKSIAEEKKRSQKISFLKSMRDKVLGLQVIVVELDNEDDAYLIFETLNTRGKELEASDLVKNHITKLMKPSNINNDVAKVKWSEIAKVIGEAEADIELSQFLHHHWLSFREYTTEKALFKEVKSYVKSNNVSDYLDKIYQEAPYYRTIFEPKYRKWSPQEISIQRSLEALQAFKVRQAMPAVLSIVNDYSSDRITRKQCESILGKLEKFHFIFTAVTSQRSSGGISFMYSHAARAIRNAPSKDSKQIALKELAGKLEEKTPELPEFLLGWQNILFSDEYTRQRGLVRYILRRIDEHFRKGGAVDYSTFSIEHIISQTDPKYSEEDKASIGNLIFCDAKLNNEKLKSKEFKEKKRILVQNHVPLDEILSKAEKFDLRTIRRRTEYLAEIAYGKIWN